MYALHLYKCFGHYRSLKRCAPASQEQGPKPLSSMRRYLMLSMGNTCGVCNSSIPSYRKYCSKSCYGKSLSNKIEKDCPICEETFTTVPSRDKNYCSRECFGKSQRNRKIVDCENCDEPTVKEINQLNNSGKHFCSKDCHDEYQRDINSKVCDNCGEKYYHGGKDSNFCSKKCSAEDRSIEKVKVACPECENHSSVLPSYNDKYENIFCSSECRNSWLEENSLFASEDNPKKSGETESEFGSNWKKMREKALKRAKYECEHCSKTKEENGRSLSVHHITPRKLFLEDDNMSVEMSNVLCNLVVLCRSCHMKAEHRAIES